jgi:hypothetical protein
MALVIEGLTDLIEQLRNLPPELAGEAAPIVTGSADAAQAEVVAGYPSRTGELRSKVVVKAIAAGPLGTAVVVRNTSKLAYIFENGTQARHNALGANRGSMPAGHVFIPAMARHRRAMWEKLKGVVTRAGLVVTGDAG